MGTSNEIISDFRFKSLPLSFASDRHYQISEDLIYYTDAKLFGNASYNKIRVDRIYDASSRFYYTNKIQVLLLILSFFIFTRFSNLVTFCIMLIFVLKLVLFKKYFILLEMQNGSKINLNFYIWENEKCRKVYKAIDYMLDLRISDTNYRR